MTARPILYSFRRCPYAMRARLALWISGVPCEIREVKLSAKPVEMVMVSPKATVPVLLLPDGRVIDESLDIMEWGLGHHDPERWLGYADAQIIAANDGPFKFHLDRYKYPSRYETSPDEHRLAGLDFLRPLNERLARGPYLHGDGRGLTDAAVAPFVRQFAAVDAAWFDHQPVPWLKAWLDRFVTSSLFAAVMVKLDPWRPNTPPSLLPNG